MKRETEVASEDGLGQQLVPAVERVTGQVSSAVNAAAERLAAGLDSVVGAQRVTLTEARKTIATRPLTALALTLTAGVVLGLLLARK